MTRYAPRSVMELFSQEEEPGLVRIPPRTMRTLEAHGVAPVTRIPTGRWNGFYVVREGPYRLFLLMRNLRLEPAAVYVVWAEAFRARGPRSPLEFGGLDRLRCGRRGRRACSPSASALAPVVFLEGARTLTPRGTSPAVRPSHPAPSLLGALRGRYAVHLFDAPWGAEHARRALCGGLRDVTLAAEPVVAAWDHPEMCAVCVTAARALGPRQGRAALRVPPGGVDYPAPVLDFAALARRRERP